MEDNDRNAPSSSASALRVPRPLTFSARVRGWFARLTRPMGSTPLDEAAVLAWNGWTAACATCVRSAFREARERGQDVLPGHVLLGVLLDEDVQSCLPDVDWAGVRARLDEFLGRSHVPSHDARTSDATNLALQAAAARAQQSGSAGVRPGHLLAEVLATAPSLRFMLESAGYQRLPFLYAFSHGVPRTPWNDAAAPTGERLSLVLENDDYTTQVTVVELLEGFLGHPAAEANRLMLAVHESGRAVVATLDRAEALDMAQRIANFTTNEGCPLRITLEQAIDESQSAAVR